MEKTRYFSLLQVANSVRKTLGERYGSAFWVQAEINKLNFYQYSGHCYPELVEKKEGKVIAQMNSILWKSDFQRANQKFLEVLKEPLKDGIKVMLLARITFDPVHGIALQITDIDPSYTLGDLERERQMTIDRLKAEHLFDRNKALKLPLLPQRLALISVETSKGYADFLSVIEGNPFKYAFFHMLFPSLLQGEKAITGILSQLERIRKVKHHFDAVVIVRGGGGDVGLSCYNNYELARKIAGFPLPVLTGIGHATNLTVVEMVAHSNAITPTKLADFLLQQFHNSAVPIQHARDTLQSLAPRLIAEEQKFIESEIRHFRNGTGKLLLHKKHVLGGIGDKIRRTAAERIQQAKVFLAGNNLSLSKIPQQFMAQQRRDLNLRKEFMFKDLARHIKSRELELDALSKQVDALDPKNVLRRGFSITLLNGKAIRSGDQLHLNDQITTRLFEGELTSKITSVNNE